MAEQKKDSTGITIKTFKNIQFHNGVKYDINIQCNGQKETISIKLINKQNTKIYEQTFSKEKIESITSECKLSALDLYQVITDQLSSTDFIHKFCRLFVFSDMEPALQKQEEFKRLRKVPDVIGTIKELEGKPDIKGGGIIDSHNKACALFLLHFSPSKYVKCNYVFVIGQKHLSESDRFDIKFNELKQENEILKNELDGTKALFAQQIQQLTVKLQEIENKLEEEKKIQEINLNLVNGFQWYGTDGYAYAKPKAFKCGKIVHLQGLVKGGKNDAVIATLPEGWRPDSERIFCANQSNGSARINVLASGAIVLYTGYTQGWVPLDGIVYHTH